MKLNRQGLVRLSRGMLRVRGWEDVDLEKSLSCRVDLEKRRLVKLRDCSVNIERQSMEKIMRIKRKLNRNKLLKEKFILTT